MQSSSNCNSLKSVDYLGYLCKISLCLSGLFLSPYAAHILMLTLLDADGSVGARLQLDSRCYTFAYTPWGRGPIPSVAKIYIFFANDQSILYLFMRLSL